MSLGAYVHQSCLHSLTISFFRDPSLHDVGRCVGRPWGIVDHVVIMLHHMMEAPVASRLGAIILILRALTLVPNLDKS